jgi:hypothetical protein
MEPDKSRSAACRDEREMAWGAGLRAKYDAVAREPLPDRFRELLEQLDEVEAREI